jgi:hypothetical protein
MKDYDGMNYSYDAVCRTQKTGCLKHIGIHFFMTKDLVITSPKHFSIMLVFEWVENGSGQHE